MSFWGSCKGVCPDWYHSPVGASLGAALPGDKSMNAIKSTVQLQIRMPSSMRQAVKIEAAMREMRVCHFVQEAIKEKIARDRAAAAA